ncbi:hypothetical protein JCM11491_002738 [Sporobolomyces phaffii]
MASKEDYEVRADSVGSVVQLGSPPHRTRPGATPGAACEPLTVNIIATALATRQRGNDKFKAGDLTGALRDYHTVLLSLRGLDGKMQNFFGPQYTPEPILPVAKVSEISDKDEQARDEDADQQDSPYDVIRTALLNTHINSAAIHVKRERWQRALECAQAAQKIDERNPKASFREAQARIGLGQIAQGKAMLEEMQKTLDTPDAGIARTLAQLEVREKEKEKARNDAFRGMFVKAKSASQQSASSTRAQAGGSERGSSSSVALPSSDTGTAGTTVTAAAASTGGQGLTSTPSTAGEKPEPVSEEPGESVAPQAGDNVSAANRV